MKGEKKIEQVKKRTNTTWCYISNYNRDPRYKLLKIRMTGTITKPPKNGSIKNTFRYITEEMKKKTTKRGGKKHIHTVTSFTLIFS